MGTWGPGIYSNDTVMDLRCDCNEIFAFYGVEEGNKVLFREYKEIVERNCVDDDTASFWYALADWQWKHGMLTEQVKKKALELLKEYAGLDEWIEAGNEKNTKKRKANLDALKEQLQKEQMPYKRPRVTLARPKHNPGDIVVFQYTDIREKWWGRPDFYAPFYFASPVIAKSPLVDDIKKNDMYDFHGKWMAALCVGTKKYLHNERILPGFYDEYSVYAWYDYLSDAQPDLETLQKTGFLPFLHCESDDTGMEYDNVEWSYTFILCCATFKPDRLIVKLEKNSCLSEKERFDSLFSLKKYSTEPCELLELWHMAGKAYTEKNRMELLGIKIDNLLDASMENPAIAPIEEINKRFELDSEETQRKFEERFN